MDVTADQATQAVDSLWRSLGELAEGAWFDPGPGAFALVCGVAIPTLNGVWALQPPTDPDAVARLLRDVRDRGWPYCLQARPTMRAALEPVAASTGMTAGPDIPVMVLPGRAALRTGGTTEQLEVRRLAPGEMDRHVDLAARGFETPVELFAQMMRILSSVPGQRAYLGLVDGEPVTTALTVPTEAGSFGVFNVATPPERRGHGYGAAITAAAVLDGFDDGRSWAWLQSSVDGFGVYERLGFRTVEDWPLWLGTP